MKHFAILACGLLAAGSLLADEWDKKTVITVNETILIPGKTLAPGKYVMKLANSASDRHIVQIFNEDQTELQATILAFNNYRLDRTDKTELQYWETPAGSPPALRAWFYPGDNYGQEFAYPKEMADRLARENSAKVASYEANSSLTPQTAAQIDVNDAPQQTSPELAQRSTTPAPSTQSSTSNTTAAQSTTTTQQQPATQRDDDTLLAQNRPQPNPVTAPNADTAAQDPAQQSNAVDELPRTASPVPLVFLFALTLMGGAVAVRKMRRA